MTTRTLTALCLAAALLAAGATPAAEVPEGVNDGIKVHGHWKIEIYEPDGTLVSSVEFENSFYGQLPVVNFLARRKTVGAWIVHVYNNLDADPCLSGAGFPVGCTITEPFSTNVGPEVFKNLALTGSTALEMSGTATAARNNAVIDVVETFVGTCDPTVAPSSNCTGTGIAFTLVGLNPSVSVEAGQIIQVTVTISFS